MEQNFQNNVKYRLESQLREEYGKIVYTYTCHLDIVGRYKKYDNLIKWFQIIISGITSAGFISILFQNSWWIKLIGIILSFLLFIVNSCFKSFNINDKINSHKKAADELWIIREQYLSLITDIPLLNENDIMTQRNNLILKTSDIYKSSPSTDSKSYSNAQKALKENENQFFTEKEIDIMLPANLRRTKIKLPK